MAELLHPPFAGNARIQQAAENSPAMRVGEPDHAAVAILQQALIDAGFHLEKGADGKFGPKTAATVRAAQAKYQLGIDSGVAGRQVLAALDEALRTGRTGTSIVVPKASLRLLFQQTKTFHPGVLNPVLKRAADFLAEYEMTIDGSDRQLPPLDFPGRYDPRYDVKAIRESSERQTPGQRGWLRVIISDFVGSSTEYGVTETASRSGLPVQDFIVLNSAMVREDRATLAHEMIHATGLEEHDADQQSVFSVGNNRTLFKPEHALLVATAFFSSNRPI